MERSTSAVQMDSRLDGESRMSKTALPLILALLRSNLLQPDNPKIQQMTARAESLLSNEELQPLVEAAGEQLAIIEDDAIEQAAARKLLILFGIPYMEGAHAVWKTIVKFLDDAKETVFIAQQRLEAIITQIRTRVLFMLIKEEEKELEALHTETAIHEQGIHTLQQTQASLTGENLPAEQNQTALRQKENRLTIVEKQKISIKSSIESLKAMASNLLLGLSRLNQFDQTSMVMA